MIIMRIYFLTFVFVCECRVCSSGTQTRPLERVDLGVAGSYELLTQGLQPDSGPPEEQQVLLTAELSLLSLRIDSQKSNFNQRELKSKHSNQNVQAVLHSSCSLIVQKQELPNSSSTEEWINALWYIHKIDCHSPVKSKALIHAIQ